MVAGVAIDRGETPGAYMLTLEIVNLSAIKDGNGEESLLITAEGPTLFEAIRNAKKKLYNKLYFGSMKTMVISREIARDDGVLSILDGFMRDIEPRETTVLVISQEDSARALLSAAGLDKSNVSYEIAQIIEEDHKVDSTSQKVQLYQAYNMIRDKGTELVLPAFHLVENTGKDVVEIDGLAIFRRDRLVGFMSPEDARYFLMIINEKVGGALSFPYAENGSERISAEIFACESKQNIQYTAQALTIGIAVDIDLGIIEIPGVVSPDTQMLAQIRSQAEAHIKNRIAEIIQRAQESPGFDCFGFGNKLYMDHCGLWASLEDQWETLFQEAAVEIKVTSNITNTGLIS
jgi:spore germination protein KC